MSSAFSVHTINTHDILVIQIWTTQNVVRLRLGGISHVTVRTLWHGSSADVSSHAAASQIGGMVAGHDLYLVTGEMMQVGDDSRLLIDLQLHLCNKIRAQYPGIHSNLRDYFSI